METFIKILNSYDRIIIAFLKEFNMSVKLTILDSNCRCKYHKKGDEFIVDDLCPSICHELWQCIYPSVYVLLNNGNLDSGNIKNTEFLFRCPDEGRVLVRGEKI